MREEEREGFIRSDSQDDMNLPVCCFLVFFECVWGGGLEGSACQFRLK